MDNIISLSGIYKSYGRNKVLDGLDFNLGEGEMAFVSGKSGCGKSTLLNIIGFLDSWDNGEYRFCGKRIKRGGNALRGKYAGFIFQAYYLVDSLDVTENIMLPYLYNEAGITKDVIEEMNGLIARLDLAGLEKHKAKDLSGGEKQRVAIARALLKHPKILIADEPTGNLDGANAKLIYDIFRDYTKNGCSAVIVSHNEQLFSGCDTRYRLEGGVLNAF